MIWKISRLNDRRGLRNQQKPTGNNPTNQVRLSRDIIWGRTHSGAAFMDGKRATVVQNQRVGTTRRFDKTRTRGRQIPDCLLWSLNWKPCEFSAGSSPIPSADSASLPVAWPTSMRETNSFVAHRLCRGSCTRKAGNRTWRRLWPELEPTRGSWNRIHPKR